MTKKNKSGLIVVMVFLAIGATIFFTVRSGKKNDPSKKPKSKDELVSAIIVMPASSVEALDYNTMMTYDEDYLRAWYDALVAKKTTFLLRGKAYHSQGGTAVK